MILVTGATGFIGSRVLKKLADEGFEVAATCRKSTDYERVRDIYDKVTWVSTDNAQTGIGIDEAFSRLPVDTVIHMATNYGRNREQFADVFESNVAFPLKLLKLADENGVKTFINTDSFFTRELSGAWNIGSDVYMNAYVKSKFAFREIAREHAECLNLAFVNAELQHVYGSGDAAGKFILFLVNELKKNTPEIPLSEGKQSRDWTYIDDVVDAYLTLVRNGDFNAGTFTGFQVGTGIETSLRDFCIKMKEISGSTSTLAFGARPMNPNELMNSAADNASLRALGWSPKVDIDEGIRRLFEE